MAALVPNTILLKHLGVSSIQKEGTAGATITPGMLVSMNAAGAIVPHGVAGGLGAAKLWAIEDDLQGRGVADNYDAVVYNQVRYHDCSPGTELWAILTTAQTIVKGDALESAGNGTLRKQAAAGETLARALEAVTTTGSTARIKVSVV